MKKLVVVALVLTVVVSSGARALDFALSAEPYGTGGLFTRPLIPGENEDVVITVRATVTGTVAGPVPCALSITDPDGSVHHYDVPLAVADGKAVGTHHWTPTHNGMVRLEAKLDPGKTIEEADETNNAATLSVPVVVPGRKPHFPWFSQRDYLRWATIWAGGFKKEDIEHWLERGVMPLAWRWGNNHPKDLDEDQFYTMYSNFGGTPGVAVDECGFYPETLDPKAKQTSFAVSKFVACQRGLQRAKKEHPDGFFLVWHSGTLYPEQAAMYRKSCTLVVVESYVNYFMPKGLYTESVFGALDMKMLPARQVDMLNATGKGPQIITSVDLRPDIFHPGEIENIIRHLRERWPEMRGFGIFGGLMPKDANAEQRRQAIAGEQFVDRLCFRYFVRPVVTFLPGSLWVTRSDKGGDFMVEAALSNIGGMDTGEIRVALLADGKRLKTVTVKRVPAGDSLLQNRVIVSVPWHPRPGNHEFEARIESAPGATVIKGRISCEYFVGQ